MRVWDGTAVKGVEVSARGGRGAEGGGQRGEGGVEGKREDTARRPGLFHC